MFKNHKLVIDLTKPQQNKLKEKLQALTGMEWKFTDSRIIEGRDRSAFLLEVDTLSPLESNRINNSNWEKAAHQHGLFFNVEFMKTKKGGTDMSRKVYICHDVDFQKVMAAKKEDIFPQQVQENVAKP